MNSYVQYCVGWIRETGIQKMIEGRCYTCSVFMAGLMLFFLGCFAEVHAQVEDDTTRVEREGPERTETERYNDFIITPYQIDIPGSQMERYRLHDFGSTYSFYRRLQYYGIEDFLFDDDQEFNMYGPEWERELNEHLAMILSATFKEQNSILQLLSRIAPFLGFGFFEPYEVPIVPRIEDGDRVYTED
jgi:hypothetical protein